jgi:hypothetical protein
MPACLRALRMSLFYLVSAHSETTTPRRVCQGQSTSEGDKYSHATPGAPSYAVESAATGDEWLTAIDAANAVAKECTFLDMCATRSAEIQRQAK